MSLPAGWARAEIGDLCDLINGKAFKPSDWAREGLPIIRIQNLNRPDADFNFCNTEVDERFLVEAGELLFAWSGTPGTSFGAHVWNGSRAVLNQHIFRVRFEETAVDRDFFKRAINSTLDELISKAHGGVGLAHVTKGKFEATLVPLPPLAEQRRIVAKLDALTAHLVCARAELDRVPRLASKLRQVALDQEFARIAIGDRVMLGELGGWSSGGTPKSSEASYYNGNIPWLRSGDLPDGSIDRHVITITERGLQNSSAKWVPAGAVLIAMYGATIGKLGITTYPVTTNQAVACIAPDERTDPRWLFYFLLQKRPELIALGQGGAQPNISQQILKAIPTMRPTLEHQHIAVAKLEAAFTRANRLEAEAARARALLDRLEAALLVRAFRGELVPQDPTDEPAATLLARIRAQRGVQPKAKRGRKPKVAADA